MKTVSPDVPSPRIVMFGLQCDFTDGVAFRLAARGLTPAAVIVPGHPRLERPVRVGMPRSTLPLAGHSSPAQDGKYPTIQIGNLVSTSTLELIESFQPDVIVVACFPHLIPRAIREMSRWLSINVHPSLLPAHRGPDPLFWIMRDGGAGCGVTIHELSETFDAGDIFAQRKVPYPDGARERELENLLATTGADLVVEVITMHITGNLDRRAQDKHSATYQSWPDHADYVLSADRPTRDAWNFVRGVAGRGVPIRIESGSEVLLVSDAIDYGSSGMPTAVTSEDRVVIRFMDGWLLARAHRPASV